MLLAQHGTFTVVVVRIALEPRACAKSCTPAPASSLGAYGCHGRVAPHRLRAPQPRESRGIVATQLHVAVQHQKALARMLRWHVDSMQRSLVAGNGHKSRFTCPAAAAATFPVIGLLPSIDSVLRPPFDVRASRSQYLHHVNEVAAGLSFRLSLRHSTPPSPASPFDIVGTSTSPVQFPRATGRQLG